MIRAGIIGAAGYTAGELLRILQEHPGAEVVFAQSASHAGCPVWEAHRDLVGLTDLAFCEQAPVNEADVIFICSGHGRSKGFVHEQLDGRYDGAVIDLSNDFRLAADAEGFVYGLPEAFREEIRGARRIANPGCFATAIQLALLPAAHAGMLRSEVHVTGITGSTGAGVKPSETTHFSWREGNLSVYKPFTHQHLGEVVQTLTRLDPAFGGVVNFIPVRGNFTRGIMVTAYYDCPLSGEELSVLYSGYYRDEPFVEVVPFDPDMKLAVGTNRCILHVSKHGGKALAISMIDNLVKGASGQAVQNMNLLFGREETEGLHLRALRY